MKDESSSTTSNAAVQPSRVAALCAQVEQLKAQMISLGQARAADKAQIEALEANVQGLAAKVAQAEALFNKYKGKFGLFLT